MKKLLVLAIGAMLLTGCASSNSWHKGQAEWMRIQIHENFDYNKAFATAVDLLSEKFNHDRTQLSVKTEVQKMHKDEWINGYDTKLGQQMREDIQGVLQ